MDIVLSTHNKLKAAQIAAIFQGMPVRICTLSDEGIVGVPKEEGTTVEENSRAKALFGSATKKWSMADDTSLDIDALGGLPGINAARWAGEKASAEETMHYTLKRLSAVPEGKRGATFKTAAVIIAPDGTEKIFYGITNGKILTTPRTACPPQMPYSAIFVPDGYDKAWSEMSIEEENAISHRGEAFRHVREYLQKILNGS